MFPQHLEAQAAELISLCRAKGLTVATAESCTGGLVAAAITSIPGSSDVFERGFVTYSNAAKTECLGVPETVLQSCGAVSEEAAKAMARGALTSSKAALTVAITGIAGPGGGSAAKPVGLVYFALASRSGSVIAIEKSFGDQGRESVRGLAAATALAMLIDAAR